MSTDFTVVLDDGGQFPSETVVRNTGLRVIAGALFRGSPATVERQLRPLVTAVFSGTPWDLHATTYAKPSAMQKVMVFKPRAQTMVLRAELATLRNELSQLPYRRQLARLECETDRIRDELAVVFTDPRYGFEALVVVYERGPSPKAESRSRMSCAAVEQSAKIVHKLEPNQPSSLWCRVEQTGQHKPGDTTPWQSDAGLAIDTLNPKISLQGCTYVEGKGFGEMSVVIADLITFYAQSTKHRVDQTVAISDDDAGRLTHKNRLTDLRDSLGCPSLQRCYSLGALDTREWLQRAPETRPPWPEWAKLATRSSQIAAPFDSEMKERLQ